MTEEWRSIDWAPNYEVSSFGRVRSIDHVTMRMGGILVRLKGRVLKPLFGSRGYLVVRIKQLDDTWITVTIHRLVTEIFIGPRPEGYQVAHWDGNPTNNHISNLRYATPYENWLDKHRHGTTVFGEKHGRSKLKNEQVSIIRKRLSQGHNMTVIAKDFGVHRHTIKRIATGENWKTQENV